MRGGGKERLEIILVYGWTKLKICKKEKEEDFPYAKKKGERLS